MSEPENYDDEESGWDSCPNCDGLGEYPDECTCGEDTCCCLVPTPPICITCEGWGYTRTVKKFRLTPPKPFIPKEFDEQVAVFDYARVKAKQDRRWHLLFSTLNGVRLPIGLAKKCKRAGNKSGVPDIILPVRGYAACPGLYVELKRTKGGRIDDDQHDFHALLREQGYCVVVARGAMEAIAAIERYLSGEPCTSTDAKSCRTKTT